MVLVPLLGACSTFAGGTSNSCVSPYLDDQPPTGTYGAPAATVRAGNDLTLYGHWYTSTCDDIDPGRRDLAPLAPVRLTLTLANGVVKDLGAFTPAGQDVGFTVVIRLPYPTPAGTASVRDDGNPPAVYRFTITSAP